jgi:hypothetical protein
MHRFEILIRNGLRLLRQLGKLRGTEALRAARFFVVELAE